MHVNDIMTTDLVTVPPETSMFDAASHIIDHGTGSVLVIDAGLVGILTRTDILREFLAHESSLKAIDVTVGMSSDVVTIAPSATIKTAVRTMIDQNIRRLPVMDGLDVIGILTFTDIALHQPDRINDVRQQLRQREHWT